MKKNLITVLKKLLTAFGGDSESVQNNAVDIIDKIADSASGGGSGGDSGNTLTLYAESIIPDVYVIYKDEDYEQRFETFEEAVAAVKNAGSIKVVINDGENAALFAIAYFIENNDLVKSVSVAVFTNTYVTMNIYRWDKPK